MTTKKRVHIGISCDPSYAHALDTFCQQNNLTQSEAVRTLLYNALIDIDPNLPSPHIKPGRPRKKP